MGYYDGKGYYRNNGEGGYDAKGYYRKAGAGGYDAKGYYRRPGEEAMTTRDTTVTRAKEDMTARVTIVRGHGIAIRHVTAAMAVNNLCFKIVRNSLDCQVTASRLYGMVCD